MSEDNTKTSAYILAQVDWVEKHHVWEGARVKITRHFSGYEDGCRCLGTDSPYKPKNIVGKTFVVRNVSPFGINLNGGVVTRPDGGKINWFSAPFSALEVVEPYYDKSFFESREFTKTMWQYKRHAHRIVEAEVVEEKEIGE